MKITGMKTKGIKEDFELYYLITWGSSIGSTGDALRFIQGAKIQTGLNDKKILHYMNGLYDEGVVMSEEYRYIKEVIENET